MTYASHLNLAWKGDTLAPAKTSDVAGVSGNASDVGGVSVNASDVAGVKHKLSMGDLRKACAYRVKYRIGKQRLALSGLGVHPDNRGRVFPTSVRVQSLGSDCSRQGFLLEEADHNGCGVQDIPAEHRDEVADRYKQTFHAYNLQQVAGSPLVVCFTVASSIHIGLLGHNHLLLVLLCFKNGAKFEWSESEKAYMPLNADGCLDLELCKGNDNFTDLFTLLSEGMMTDLLGWQIHVEQPDACGLISAALNSANSMAMSCTMLQAVSVLSGECLAQCSALRSSAIDFDIVRERVRPQLDSLVDDPDFPDFFQAIINLGGDTANYLREFVDFGAKFVDQKKRKLRMQTFVAMNKIDINKPLTKKACLKRACRKTPQNGYCPDPEPIWSQDCPSLDSLERLLHFWHHDCKADVAALKDPYKEAWLLANVDIHAAEAWYACKSKTVIVRVREDLIKATQKYAAEIKLDQKSPGELPQKDQWLDYRQKEPTAPIVAAPTCTVMPDRIMPRVIQFSEDGRALNMQDEMTIEETRDSKTTIEVALPWRAWLSTFERGIPMTATSRKSIAQRAASTALSIMRRKFAHADAGVEIYQNLRKTGKLVRATKECEPGEILLPPVSINEETRLPEEATSLYKVPISVRTLVVGEKGKSKSSGKGKSKAKTKATKKKQSDNDGGDNDADDDDDASTIEVAVVGSTFTFYALYEWVQPTIDAALHLENAAKDPSCTRVTDRMSPSQNNGPIHEYEEPSWKFPETKLCSMFPFWAVRRATDKGIEDEKLEVNMDWQDKLVSVVGMSQVSSESCSETIEVTIPCLVNTEKVRAGTQLVVRIDDEVKKPSKRKRTWQVDREKRLGEQAKEEKKQAKAAEKAKEAVAKKPKATLEI